MGHHSESKDHSTAYGNETHDHAPEDAHHVPYRTFVTVILVLFFLTFVTVAIAQFEFGNFNLIVAMFIASIKAGIVMLFFMHLKYENPLIWIYVLFPIVLVAVMISGIFIDNPTRYVPGSHVLIEEYGTTGR